MSTKKIAVIGAGNWGKNLVRNFYDLRVLTAVADVSPALRETISNDFPNVSLYPDYRELLDGTEDAVAIATPAPSHFNIAKSFLEAGKDVFVEKPMTLSRKDSEELIRIAEEKNRILMVGHLLLYQPAIRFIKNYLSDGNLGAIYHLHQERKKLGRARYVENVTWSLGVHDLAVLIHLVGDSPRHVFASGHCGLQEKVEDDVYVHLTFAGGVKAHLHNSWLWPENRRRLTIILEQGMLVYDEIEGTVSLHRKTIDKDLNSRDEGCELLFQGGEPPLKLELQHFLDCLEIRQAPISDGKNGLAVVEALERILMI